MITGCLATVFWCQFDSTEKVSLVHRDGVKRTVVVTYMDVSFSNSERSGPCRRGYIYIPVACAVMLYLVYLVECWHSHAWLELRYKSDITSVYSTIKKMQQALPVIWWKATCYHYVRRTRQVTRYRNGDAFTSTQVYYERVNSNTAGAAFNFTRCGVKDISRPLSDLEKYPAIKIKISKGFSFANLDTEFEFEEQRSQFFQEYETKDDYMEGREGMDLINVDFKEYTIAFRDPNNLPWYVSHAVFWIGSLILLSWPIRTIIEFKTAHLHYHIHKLFGSNYLDLDNYPGLISRVSTMNSSEFELSIRNNNAIVPSYSEAMIADINEQIQRRDYGTIKMCKFPRSLTNVTFARRTSSSFTPTVTMNQVKKFKSCNVFGKSESIDSSLNSGSLRHQIHQLVRDRGRIHGKQSSTSQYSISGLSVGNGNIRFHNGSTISPDELTATTNFSYHHSPAPKKIKETISGDAVASGAASTDMEDRVSVSIVHQKERCKKSRQFVRDIASPVSVLNRSKSVPGPDIQGQDGFTHSPSEIESSLEFLPVGLEHDLVKVTSTCLPESNANFISTTTTISATTTPSTPSSPPGYEDAIKMRQFASSLIPNTDVHSPHHSSPIGLTENSSTVQTRSTMSITGIRAFPGGKRNTNLAGEDLTIDLGINLRQSKDPPQVNCDISRLESSDVQSMTRLDQEKYSSSHHEKGEKRRITAPTFKELPKVCKISSGESQDSDFGCLHSTGSYLGYLDDAQSKHGNFSNRTSEFRSFGIGSISRLVSTAIPDDGAINQSGLNSRTINRMTPSTAVSTAAAALSDSSGVPASSKGRMETSV